MSHTTTELDPQNTEAVKLRGMSLTSATCQQVKTCMSRVIWDTIVSGGFLYHMGKTALKKNRIFVREIEYLLTNITIFLFPVIKLPSCHISDSSLIHSVTNSG
jgi:hypothetical protein